MPGEFGGPEKPAGLDSLPSTLLFILIDPSSLLPTSPLELTSLTSLAAGVTIRELSFASQSSSSYSTILNCFCCSNFCLRTAAECASYLAVKFISFIRCAVLSKSTYKTGISRWNCDNITSSSLRYSSECPIFYLLFSF